MSTDVKESNKVLDLKELPLEMIDFTERSGWRWVPRRLGIGLLIFFYYVYAACFIMVIIGFLNYLKIPHIFGMSKHAISDLMQEPLMLMSTFGFLGSVFVITRTFVRTANKIDLPASWYVTRPLTGVLLALFIYYAFRAGQLVFYSSGGVEGQENEINVYSLSILAIITGIFAEEAYKALYALGKRVLNIKQDTTGTPS
jgi:hypothetical protein